jgi:hypothetical protein
MNLRPRVLLFTNLCVLISIVLLDRYTGPKYPRPAEYTRYESVAITISLLLTVFTSVLLPVHWGLKILASIISVVFWFGVIVVISLIVGIPFQD